MHAPPSLPQVNAREGEVVIETQDAFLLHADEEAMIAQVGVGVCVCVCVCGLVWVGECVCG